ncbi:hypothetical protein Tco_0773227 [Tanacetum coccineum]|uniref:Uncharacterized protein n=1 Tax=Tanacetum coccineum TaxID=301880 RepID=A0ABQ4ZLF6_9ASTR
MGDSIDQTRFQNVSKHSNDSLPAREWDDIQAKIDADYQLAKRFQAQEQEELSIEEKKMFDRAFKRVNTFVDFRTDLVEGSSKRAGE